MGPEDYITLTLWYSKMKFMNTIIDMSFYVIPTILGGAALGVFGYGIYQTAQGLVNTTTDVIKTVASLGIKGALFKIGLIGSGITGAVLGKKTLGAVKGALKGTGYFIAKKFDVPTPVFRIGKDTTPSFTTTSQPKTETQQEPQKETVVITADTHPREFREGLIKMHRYTPWEEAKKTENFKPKKIGNNKTLYVPKTYT